MRGDGDAFAFAIFRFTIAFRDLRFFDLRFTIAFGHLEIDLGRNAGGSHLLRPPIRGDISPERSEPRKRSLEGCASPSWEMALAV